MSSNPSPKGAEFMISFMAQLGAVLVGMLLVFAGVLLTGCATGQEERPKVEVITTKVMVAEPCIEQAPVRPAYHWGVGPRPANDKAAVAILLGDYEAARQYGIDWEAAAAGCVKRPTEAAHGATNHTTH